MMKKLLALLVCANLMTVAFAQSVFTVSPYMIEGNEVMLLGESMSQNHAWVAGTDQLSGAPMVWNVSTNDVSLYLLVDTVDQGGWTDEVPMMGSFHSVNSNGQAVGGLNDGNYVSHPIMATAGGELTFLYTSPEDAGCEAYGITEDGSLIVGFFFDTNWIATACLWSENGTVRTPLPSPTEEQLGFPYDYASARWISGDGNTILGIAQDYNTGAWVAMAWVKQNGEWTINAFCHDYYQTKYYTEEGELVLPGNNPYFDFEPIALSDNGQWVSLKVLASHDPMDWDNVPLEQAARYNLTTNTFQVAQHDGSYTELRMFGIANDGTAVGRLSGEMDFETWEQPVDAVLWTANGTSLRKLSEIYPNEEYCAGMIASAFSSISGDGSYAMGYSSNEFMEQTTFIVALDPAGEEGIEMAEAEVALYPNPAATTMAVSADEMIRTISVINLKGQVVRTQQINANSAVLDVQNLAEGMYILSIVTDNGLAVKKVAIAR